MPYQLVLKHLFSKTNFAFNLILLMLFRERYPIMTPSNFFYRPFERVIDQQGQDSIMQIHQTLQKPKKCMGVLPQIRDKSGSNSLPFQGNVEIPPSLGTKHGQMPRVCPGGGGDVEASI